MNEPLQVLPAVPVEEQIDLRRLIWVLWDGRWLIGSVAFAVVTISVLVAFLLPSIYRAEALLVPNQEHGAGELSELAAQYGGFANLAGVSLRGGTSDKTALGLEMLKSRKFFSEFVAHHDILVPLMAAKKWDPDTGEVIVDSDMYDKSAGKWVRDVNPPRKSIPSIQEAYEIFRDEVLYISQDKNTGFVRLAVEHKSPAIAKQWVNWLVEDINTTIMSQDVEEAEQAIAYLEVQIEATSLADLQNVFFRLIEEQTKTVLLAKVSPEYLFRTVDPAIAPEQRSSPRRALIVVLGLILGLAIGVVMTLVKSSLTAEQK